MRSSGSRTTSVTWNAGESGFKAWRERARARREDGLLAGVPELIRNYPDYRVGPIATGDVVSAAASFARWLRARNRKLAAVEMEAGGVAQAIHGHGQADLLVVRGISDFADERKSDLDATAAREQGGAWRRYAALNAADLFAAMVARLECPRDHRRPDVGRAGRSGWSHPGVVAAAQDEWAKEYIAAARATACTGERLALGGW